MTQFRINALVTGVDIAGEAEVAPDRWSALVALLGCGMTAAGK